MDKEARIAEKKYIRVLKMREVMISRTLAHSYEELKTMSLPFFDKKKTVSMIIEKRGKTPLEVSDETDMSGLSPELKEACEDILRAIEQKSVVDLARGIIAAMNQVASEPESDEGHEA